MENDLCVSCSKKKCSECKFAEVALTEEMCLNCIQSKLKAVP